MMYSALEEKRQSRDHAKKALRAMKIIENGQPLYRWMGDNGTIISANSKEYLQELVSYHLRRKTSVIFNDEE